MEENLLPPRDLKFSSARTEMYAVFSHPALLHSFFLPSGKTKHVRMQPQLFPMLRHKFPTLRICKDRTPAIMYLADCICTFLLCLWKVEVCLRSFLRHTIHDVSCGRNPRIGMQRFPVCSVNVQFQVHNSPSRCSTVPRRETPAITNCCNMSVLVTLRKYRKIVISHCASFSSITFTISLNYFFLHHITLQEDGFRIPKYFHTQAGNVG